MLAEPDVVPMMADHIDGFHRALDVVARERRYLTLLEAPPPERTRDFVLEGLRKGDPRFVAVAASEVVGWCDIGRHPFAAHAHRGSLGMGLVPEFRGRGLGFRLITAALHEAWASHFTRVELSVHADNARALALYAKVEFAREGIVRDSACIDGQYRDAITMAIVQR